MLSRQNSRSSPVDVPVARARPDSVMLGDKRSRSDHGRPTLRLLAALVPILMMLHPGRPVAANQGLPVSTPVPSCLVPAAGAPSCGIETAPGSARYESPISHHVGNPIDVISGNKYQYELDFRSPVSGLVFARHYNSSLAGVNTGLGAGWRHSYQVVLSRTAEHELQIVQSDGRRIRFRHSAGDSPGLYRAAAAADGHLQTGERNVWFLGDGRRLVFQGSYLVQMYLGDHGGVLTLNYHEGRLIRVSDNRGQQLAFRHVPGQVSLPDYGSQFTMQPAGALAAVILPGGAVIDYRYGRLGNLRSVEYPANQQVGYRYENRDWPFHLTGRVSTIDGRISQWRYDEAGNGIGWDENDGANGLNITRHAAVQTVAEDVDDSQRHGAVQGATVVRADGRRTRYRWRADAGQASTVGTVHELHCDNCLAFATTGAVPVVSASVMQRPGSSDSLANPVSVSEQTTAKPDRASFGESIHQMLKTLQIDQDQFEVTADRIRYTGTFPHDQGAVDVRLVLDRTGKVRDLAFGVLPLTRIIAATIDGRLPRCFAGDSPDNSQTFLQDRVRAMATGEPLCRLDPTVLMEFIYRVEQRSRAAGFVEPAQSVPESSSGESTDSTDEPGSSRESGDDSLGILQRKRSLPFWNPLHRYCDMPGSLTCADLDVDLEMARLSRCVYAGGSCESDFRLVQPAELGMSHRRFDDLGFNASLYEDTRFPGRYILAFRGTDNVGDDWEANFAQARAERTRQYDLAVQLSRDVSRNLSESHLEMTGHSLGGGLASIAALATGRPATIFNAAALQPGTAALYGYDDEYADAERYIRHIHTDSDPVTYVQDVADDLDYRDLQTVPGATIEIHNPDTPWMNATYEAAESFREGFWPLIYHSINAVIQVLEQYREYNCLA